MAYRTQKKKKNHKYMHITTDKIIIPHTRAH
jgi:hypothetical protein